MYVEVSLPFGRVFFCENKTELKTGALCCIVASRPLVTTKSPPHSGTDIPSLSQDDSLQWRTNLSFSPSGYTRDGLEHDMSDESHRFALYSTTSRPRQSLESSFQQSPRWTSNSPPSARNEQKTCIANTVPRPIRLCLDEEEGFDRESTAISTSFRSLLSLPQSSTPWETPSKQLSNLTHCSYPQVFCNPVSDCDNPEPDNTQDNSSTNPDSSFVMSTRNHQGSPAVEEASPNSSSDDMLLDVERSNESEVGSSRFKSGSLTHQRCGICKKLLSQKSPWCSYKILRCGDMPTAGIFPCHHVYHVECLDKVTPTAQTRDPSCPVCSNTIGAMEQPLIVPETLQMALRSLRRSHIAVGSETVSTPSNDNQRRHSSRRSEKWEKLSCCLNISFSFSSQNPT